jgi:serine/threonine protein kinase
VGLTFSPHLDERPSVSARSDDCVERRFGALRDARRGILSVSFGALPFACTEYDAEEDQARRMMSHTDTPAPAMSSGELDIPSSDDNAVSAHHAPGTVLGSYRIDDVLGEGGMGIVYLATHVHLQRRVAIKVLRTELLQSEQALRRFFAEARAVNRIAHPNVIEVTDFVEGPGEANYYVMELLEGASLAALLHHGGIPSLDRSIAIMTQLAGALVAVHAAGIVHRDIKPDNIVLIQRGGDSDFVKLVDFGLAKLIDSGADAIERPGHTPGLKITELQTAQGALLGTPGYMSPEQAAGTPLDHRTDIYSFGVMLYELVTGVRPHIGSTVGEMVVSLLTEPPLPPSQVPDLPHVVPPALEELILQCLAKEQARRPLSIEYVLEQLEAIAEEQGWLVYELVRPTTVSEPMPVLTRPTTSPPLPPADPIAATMHAPPAMKPRRRWWPFATAGTVVIALGLATIAWAGDGRRTTASRLDAALALADARVADGRLVAPDGDAALDHLLAARAIAPADEGVHLRLRSLADKFTELATQATAADSLAEAAAHWQAVLVIDPADATAAARMDEIEQAMLTRQRTKGR